MKGIARQLAISETQLINKGMENMHIMCVGLVSWKRPFISSSNDVHSHCVPFDHIWQLAMANLAQNRQPADQITEPPGCTAITIKMAWCGAIVGSAQSARGF